ncbi:hypothetical protein KP509_39G001900 [Ceratopteris richardii]|uniref:Uncharacterized protein n=1 Tax=Ceratopteris richardii TaxID=49495 RepID=A0A8T2PY36_CERRI|nr:hypothetical protein KP509_39G001900 [Ceratopteris richardii]
MVLSSPKMVSLSATSAFYPLHVRLHCFTLKRQSFSVCDGRFFRFRISSSIPPHFFGDGHMVQSESHDQYAVASKVETFLEEKLNDALTEKPGNIHQIVLLTDSEDLTPYQLQCPPFTVIFHVSMYPTTRALEVPKSCLVRYVYGELERCVGSEGWTDKLQRVGYQGNKPSIWLLQGLNFNAENKFRETIENISGQIMKGSLLIGGLNANIGGLSESSYVCQMCRLKMQREKWTSLKSREMKILSRTGYRSQFSNLAFPECFQL